MRRRREACIAELRETGRLNEENLRYLDVRLKAGLGYWPQIARDHWLIQTLSDLALPPQTLDDLLEALYRTYIDTVEAAGNPTATLKAFEQHIARRYPRLFALTPWHSDAPRCQILHTIRAAAGFTQSANHRCLIGAFAGGRSRAGCSAAAVRGCRAVSDYRDQRRASGRGFRRRPI